MKLRLLIILGVIIMGVFKIVEAEPTTNLCQEPSGEITPLAIWTATGTSSIARSSDESWRGLYSLKATFGGAGTIASYTDTLPTATTTYKASCYVWVPANWNGDDIFIDFFNFVGFSDSITAQWTAGTDDFEKWHYIESTLTVAADVTGDFVVAFTGVPTATRFIYIDAFQIEEAPTATTYCDGDQPGCDWNGTPHASTSFRSALSSAGGIESDMLDDLGFDVQSVQGLGAMTKRLNVQPLAGLSGDLYQSQKRLAQPVTFVGTMEESTMPLFHNERAAVGDAFDPDGVLRDQPRYIIYTGADTEKELKAYYEGGLEANMDGWPREIGTPIRTIAYEPGWQARGDGSAITDTNDTLAVESIVLRDRDGNWDALGPSSSGGTVHAIAIHPTTGDIYVGGAFLNWDGTANADNIVYWDKSALAWVALSTGLSSTVFDMAFGADGTLYAVGDFADAGGDVNADFIAQWNGVAFSAVGNPNSGGATIAAMYSVKVAPSGKVYVGGNYDTLAGVASTNNIASWDGTTWAALGTGTDATVFTLDITNDETVYVGGTFANAGGSAAAAVAFYDTAWNTMSSGMSGGAPTLVAILRIASDGSVYAGGDFTTAGGNAAAKIACWDGSAWNALGDGLNGDPDEITEGPDGMLHVGGVFTTAGAVTVKRVARWNGSSWLNVDTELPGSPTVRAIAVGTIDPVLETRYDLYMGFGTNGNATVSGTTTITNDGNLVFLPLIKIDRAGGTTARLVMIRNERNGTEMDFDYSLLNGEELTIDLRVSRDPHDRRGPSITSSLFGLRGDAVLPGSDFTEFQLEPGDNVISALVTTSGGPIVTMTMLWRALYRGVDD